MDQKCGAYLQGRDRRKSYLRFCHRFLGEYSIPKNRKKNLNEVQRKRTFCAGASGPGEFLSEEKVTKGLILLVGIGCE
jgi:hypothetical protein